MLKAMGDQATASPFERAALAAVEPIAEQLPQDLVMANSLNHITFVFLFVVSHGVFLSSLTAAWHEPFWLLDPERASKKSS
jgi:fatty acid desaturase